MKDIVPRGVVRPKRPLGSVNVKDLQPRLLLQTYSLFIETDTKTDEKGLCRTMWGYSSYT